MADSKKKNLKIRTAAEAKAKRSIGRAAVAVAIAGLIAILFLPFMLLIIAGMSPTLVAYVVDTNPKKYAAKTVAWVNFAGCLPVALDLWAGGLNIDLAIELLSDPFNWLMMLGAASVGWILFFALPPSVATYLSLTFDHKINSETERQKRLVKEWGTDVAANAPKEELTRVAEEEELAKERANKASMLKPKMDGKAAGGTDGKASGEDDLFDFDDEDADEEEAAA